MKNCNLNQVARSVLLLAILTLTTLGSKVIAQVTTNSGSGLAATYPTLNDAIIALNGATISSPVVITLTGNETAPVGGYSITAQGTAVNTIIIEGSLSTITANGGLTAGSLNDGIFKLIGADYVTIRTFTMQENAANTTTAAATNNMTEWGVALLYATTTNGAQNNTIQGNTISLGATYQNAFGVYSNSTHSATVVTTSASATTAAGANSGLTVIGNTISNVNNGIVVVGPTAVADFNAGLVIGTMANPNTITYGLNATFSGFTNVSGTVNGILVRNTLNANVEYNTLISNGTVTAGTLNGIQFQAFSNTPTATFTQNINNNTINIRSNVVGGSVNGINCPSGSASFTSTCNINNNNFTNFGHTIAGASGTLQFILNGSTHQNISISNNTFTNITVNTTGSVTFISNSITAPANGIKNVNNNSIVTQFTKTGAGGTVLLFTDNGGDPATVVNNTNNNNFSNITVNGATALTGLSNTNGGTPLKSVSNNTLTNWSGGTSAIIAISQNYAGTNTVVNNNTINAITGQGAITGITFGTSNSGALQTISGNTISNLSSTGTGGNVIGINSGASSVIALNINNNSIFNLSSSNVSGQALGIINSTTSTTNTFANEIYNLTVSGATNPLTAGIAVTGTGGTQNIHRNKIYAISASGAITTNAAVNGIAVQGGVTVNTYNNVISGLTAPLANAANPICGIQVTSAVATSTQRVHFNSIYLNATSTGTNFGTSGILHTGSTTATTAALDLRNNIIINESTPVGTGLTVAFRRGTASSTNLTSSSNNNLLYAGTPSATNLIYTDGTPQQTILAYQTNVLPLGHDANSFTGEAAFTGAGYGTAGNYFISLTGSSSDFLRPVAGITSQTESGAVNITTPLITVDYSNVTRAGNAGYVGTGSNPDCGAYEFAGTSPAPVITLNSVTPPATPQCSTSSRLISVSITTLSGTITSANIGYSVNGVPQTNIPMTNTSGNIWEGTLPASTPVNASIAWGVAASNSIGLNSSYTGSTYADEPLLGATATATASSATVCSNNPSMLTATLNKPGQIATGTGSTSSTNVSATNPFYGGFGGVKSQYIIRASELTAAGLSAGNITQLGMTVTTVGSTLSGFAISVENTALTALTGNIENVGNQVFSTASFVPALGVNNFPFSTPLMWDGTSNLIVSICWSNNNTSNTASQVLISNPGFTSSNARYVDSKTSAEVCGYIGNTLPSGWNGASTTTTSRPIFIVSGNVAPAISSVTWMDGATTVGTGNPLTVNPTATTSYTANITSSGCIATAPTTTVTVNPLPATPTAVNSAQCGTQVPSASVTSTSGLPTPTFNWYAAASGGTALQSSTSTTYTTALSTTTTFYVSELNTVTGCESARVAVTVNVSSPDNILAATSSATVCVGSPVTLTVSNTNPTPFQNYTYTWTNAQAGSGLTSATGASQTITPTQSGSFTYDVAGVDGGCTAVSSIAVTVTPYTATLTPINITCNGANNGSFSVASQSCGTANLYAVDGGAFGPLPTNLTPGAHTVIVQNTGGYQTAPISITITEPAAVPAPLGTSNATVCQGNPSATLTVPATGSQSTTVNFSLSAQPLEGNSAPGNVIATATLPVLPAGATVNTVVLSSNGIIPNGGEYQSDVRLGLSGAFTNAAAQGTGTLGSGTVAGTPYNYTRSISGTGFPTNGGTINVVYWNNVNDVTTGDDATFPLGASAFTLTINYSYPNPTVNWYNASTGGTLQGTGTPFQTVGTTVLPNTNTPGTYTFYAEGTNGTCVSATRTPVTVTVNPTSTSTTTVSACGSYTWTNGTTYTTSGTYTRTLTNYLGCDSVATLALTIKLPTTATQSATACSSYTWPVNGTAYTATGTYTHTLVGANAAGCDSTITLNLTINQPTTATQSATACVTYTWPVNGTTYTTSGAYTHTLVGANSVGCDSTITLNLTINQPTSSTVTVSACGSYTWAENSTTYTISGSYPVVLAGANANGCDSTVTLNLTINQPTSSTVTATACGSYTWSENSATYTTSGSYSVVLAGANANGCDSTITLNLTINQPTSSTVTATACGSYTWAENSTTYTTSGSYSVVLAGANANGCDSTVTLNLTINQPTSSTVTATACGSYTWAENGTTYTVSGSYPVVLAGANANGCDSTVTLNLTINSPATSTDVQTACDTYTWIDGVTYTASNNTATFTIPGGAANGCDSIVTLNLTITGTPVATATDNGNGTITASSGTTYQWIDCATGTAIAGANSQTFTVTANGNYAVVVANGSCDDTSACVLIDYIGIKEITDASIEVSPNPTSGVVMIKMTAPNAKVSVMDAQGKLLNVFTVENAGTVDLSTYQTGVYILNIETENGRSLERIIKN